MPESHRSHRRYPGHALRRGLFEVGKPTACSLHRTAVTGEDSGLSSGDFLPGNLADVPQLRYAVSKPGFHGCHVEWARSGLRALPKLSKENRYASPVLSRRTRAWQRSSGIAPLRSFCAMRPECGRCSRKQAWLNIEIVGSLSTEERTIAPNRMLGGTLLGRSTLVQARLEWPRCFAKYSLESVALSTWRASPT